MLNEHDSLKTQKIPALPDIGIVAFVPEAWDTLWMTRHQILTRLAKYFYVVWVDPAREWREHWLPGKSADAPSLDSVACPPGFVRYRPGRWLPQVYRPAPLGAWLAAQRVRCAKALLRRQGCAKTVFYIWRPAFAHVLDAATCDLSCYHIDDEYSFSTTEQPLDQVELGLIRRVDQVFVHSPALFEKKGHLNPHTLYVSNGVEYASFAAPHDEPADIKHISHPRIGYVGNIKTQLNLELLCKLASEHHEWSFIFVGPKGCLGDDARFVEQLAAMGNVHFLGFKSVKQLCAYPKHLDVCLLPYKVNDYTKYIYPLKLHEYLAGGKPIVGAPIRSLLDFTDVIKIANTPDEWSRALTESLEPDQTSSEKIEERRSIARKCDWEVLVHDIARTMCDRLGSPHKEEFSKIKLEMP